ncbi:MAG: radical SAM/SPASM domain-containing protein, partial [Alistipes sp.]|nr:radical SAM/SPASM domain-containing protein [Alistipes sp.]
ISACASIRAHDNQGNINTAQFWDGGTHSFAPYRNREWMRTGECADCSYFRYCKGNGMHLRDDEGKLMFCHLKRLM